MSADVNVTQMAAQAFEAAWNERIDSYDPETTTPDEYFADTMTAALSVLHRPDVLAGIAEHLWDSVDDKGIRGRLYREDCDYLAAAVVAWITGRQP